MAITQALWVIPTAGVVASATWVYFDVRERQRVANEETQAEPLAESEQESYPISNAPTTAAGWFWLCLLLWVIGFPWYLITRFKAPGPRGNTPAYIAIGGVLALGVTFVALYAQASSEGPPVSTMEAKSLTYWNGAITKAYDAALATGASDSCTYSPSSWAPGYTFECFVYDSASSQVGYVTITATDSPAGEWLWNWRAYLS